MPKVVPSQVAAVIKKIYPTLEQFEPHTAFDMQSGGALEGILDLVRQIPPELITLSEDDYAAFVQSVATIRFAVDYWRNQGAGLNLSKAQGYNRNALRLLFDCVRKCADESALPGTSGLEFVDDADLRSSIRTDLSAAHVDYVNGEWKSCAVMCGAVIEALLLWALLKRGREKAANVVKDDYPDKAPELESWRLATYVKAAERLKIIDQQTAQLAVLSGDFRSLIHPGREIRLRQSCTKGTALAALGVAERIAEGISKSVQR